MSEDIAWGVTVGFTPDGGSLVPLGQVYSLSPPNISRDAVDATKLASPGRFRQFIKGLLDGGEMSMQVLMETSTADGAAFKALRDDLSSTAIGVVSVTWLDGTGISFPGFVTGLQPSGDPAEKRLADVTFKVAGQITWTDAA